jgi:hypothetical protein
MPHVDWDASVSLVGEGGVNRIGQEEDVDDAMAVRSTSCSHFSTWDINALTRTNTSEGIVLPFSEYARTCAMTRRRSVFNADPLARLSATCGENVENVDAIVFSRLIKLCPYT